jgi:hypothetical protein
VQIDTKESTTVTLDSNEVRTAIVEKLVMEGIIPHDVLKSVRVDFVTAVDLEPYPPESIFVSAKTIFDSTDYIAANGEKRDVEAGPPVHVGKLLESLRGSLNVLRTADHETEFERGRSEGWREAVAYLERIVKVFAGLNPNEE